MTAEDARRPAGGFGLVKIGAATVATAVIVGGAAVGAMAMTAGSEPQSTIAPASPAPLAVASQSGPSEADLMAAEVQRRKSAAYRAVRAARQEITRRPALAPKGIPLPSKTPQEKAGGSSSSAGNPVPAGEAQRIAKALLPSYGFDPSTQFGCLVELWNRESGWRVTAGSPSGAYGIPQALPGSKMATAGPDWQTNASTQIKWGLGYIKSRYKTPCGGWAAFQSQGWY